MTTDLSIASEVVSHLRSESRINPSPSLSDRLDALEQIDRFIEENEQSLLDALHEDLGKPRAEGWLTELALVRGAVRDLRHRLPRFVRPRRIPVPLVQRPGSASVAWEPLGCCLVIAPWNYPLQLGLIPAASALAAGNTVIIKPSELAPATSNVIAELLPNYLHADRLAVVEGGAETTQALIDAGVDHVLFTGSATTGRAVMQAAARHLTPVTLELGGKNPAYVSADADLAVAARRIAFAKFLNAGQSCVAPDYVLVEEPVRQQLIAELAQAVHRFFGAEPGASPDFARIINDTHFSRLTRLAETHGGRETLGGEPDERTRYFPPTLVEEPEVGSELMSEEIFGPILPVLGVESPEAAAAFIATRPDPLAVYCFTSKEETASTLEQHTRSGAFCTNTAAEQFALMALPFGGVGESGIGAYHGAAGLETFSHRRSRLRKGTRPEGTIAYPPSNPLKRLLLRIALRA